MTLSFLYLLCFSVFLHVGFGCLNSYSDDDFNWCSLLFHTVFGCPTSALDHA